MGRILQIIEAGPIEHAIGRHHGTMRDSELVSVALTLTTICLITDLTNNHIRSIVPWSLLKENSSWKMRNKTYCANVTASGLFPGAHLIIDE